MSNHRNAALAAGILGLVSLSFYALLITREGNNSIGEIAPWMITVATPASLALWGSTQVGSRARGVLIASAVVFAAIGVLAVFSVGILFLAAGVLAGMAAARAESQ